MKLPANFIAGYKYHPDQPEIYWLCNHPESLDLIFSKDKAIAFIFDDELTALTAMNEILFAENHPWYCPVIENLRPEPSAAVIEYKRMTLEEAEAKINGFLKLFNERSNSRLSLFLTLNKKDNSIRGYGSGVKLGEEVANFVGLLAIKGMKAQCLDQHTFIVKLER